MEPGTVHVAQRSPQPSKHHLYTPRLHTSNMQVLQQPCGVALLKQQHAAISGSWRCTYTTMRALTPTLENTLRKSLCREEAIKQTPSCSMHPNASLFHTTNSCCTPPTAPRATPMVPALPSRHVASCGSASHVQVSNKHYPAACPFQHGSRPGRGWHMNPHTRTLATSTGWPAPHHSRAAMPRADRQWTHAWQTQGLMMRHAAYQHSDMLMLPAHTAYSAHECMAARHKAPRMLHLPAQPPFLLESSSEKKRRRPSTHIHKATQGLMADYLFAWQAGRQENLCAKTPHTGL